MSAPGVAGGLTRSAFLADIDARDRAPLPILGTLAVGFPVGLIGAGAAMTLAVCLYLLGSGRASEGLGGFSELLIDLRDTPSPSLAETCLQLLITASSNAAFFLVFVAVAAAFAGRTLYSYITVARAWRWRLLLVGLILGFAVIGSIALVDRLVSADADPIPLLGIAHGWGGRLTYLLAALLLVPAAAAEELAFRGWLLRQISAFTRRPILLVSLCGLLFAAAHFDFSPDGFLARTLMGASFAYMTLRLGGIEFATAVHAANNILIVLFVQPMTLQTLAPSSGLTFASLSEDVALVAGYVLITEAVARTPILRGWAGVRPAEISPSVLDSNPHPGGV